MKNHVHSLLAVTFLMACSPAALAHVSLEQDHAEAGAAYKAVLRVGHGCDGAPTTAVAVQIPPGFDAVKPLPRPGWKVLQQGGAVTWSAAGPDIALPSKERGEFVLTGQLPRAPGPLWFKVLQTCGQARLDWSQVPAPGVSVADMKMPAALLQVLSRQDFAQVQRVPKVEGAWVRSAVPGQQGTGGFMKLTARQATQLVGVSTPVAGIAEVHEMKMEGDVMRMRALPKLDLPAGRTVELKPGGYHLMLMDLKQPLVTGSTVPLTLVLRDAKGVESRLELKVPVAAATSGAHKH